MRKWFVALAILSVLLAGCSSSSKSTDSKNNSSTSKDSLEKSLTESTKIILSAFGYPDDEKLDDTASKFASCVMDNSYTSLTEDDKQKVLKFYEKSKTTFSTEYTYSDIGMSEKGLTRIKEASEEQCAKFLN